MAKDVKSMVGKNTRKAAIGKKVNAKGNTVVYTRAGNKVSKRAGDKMTTNKKGEKVIVRANGNKVVYKASGRIARVKKDGTRVVTLARQRVGTDGRASEFSSRTKVEPAPKGLTPVRGSRVYKGGGR